MINLKLMILLIHYQKLLIWMFAKSNLFYVVASRATAKTWCVAVWSLALCTLYPGIKIKICAKTIKQAAEILIEKHRNGPTGGLDLYFDENRVSFRNLDKSEYTSDGAMG